MVDVLMPLAVFGSFVLIVGQLTRLLGDISLNRTLREALRSNPESVPLLVQKIGSREPWTDALIGWIFVAFAGGLALMSLFENPDDRHDILQAAIVPLIVGVVVLAYVRWAKAEATRGLGVPPVAPAAPAAPAAPTAPRPPRRPRTRTGT